MLSTSEIRERLTSPIPLDLLREVDVFDPWLNNWESTFSIVNKSDSLERLEDAVKGVYSNVHLDGLSVTTLGYWYIFKSILKDDATSWLASRNVYHYFKHKYDYHYEYNQVKHSPTADIFAELQKKIPLPECVNHFDSPSVAFVKLLCDKNTSIKRNTLGDGVYYEWFEYSPKKLKNCGGDVIGHFVWQAAIQGDLDFIREFEYLLPWIGCHDLISEVLDLTVSSPTTGSEILLYREIFRILIRYETDMSLSYIAYCLVTDPSFDINDKDLFKLFTPLMDDLIKRVILPLPQDKCDFITFSKALCSYEDNVSLKQVLDNRYYGYFSSNGKNADINKKVLDSIHKRNNLTMLECSLLTV